MTYIALHYAVQYGSTEVLELLLNVEGCDVDIQNRLTKSTPLHLAVKLFDLDTRHYIVQSLLEAGADFMVRNKHGQLPKELVPEGDSDCKKFIRDAEAERAQADDVASDSDDDAVGSDDVASD
ncbi:hypothetical protein FS842_004854 [Serendipita sp. 407]|nr:hypothetical protein FS842_004854 [Serendipita sp. 407]